MVLGLNRLASTIRARNCSADKAAELAAEIMPDVPISLSHEVLPEMQEYERTLTTVANAAVRPVVGRYVRSLRDKLAASGMTGKLSLLRSDGGLMSAQKAEEQPVNILMSGPAGGVTGALWVASNAGLSHAPSVLWPPSACGTPM